MKNLRFFMLLLGCCISLPLMGQTMFEGFALYNEQNSNTAYLIDANGDIAHSWSCNTACNYALFLKDDGNIIRGGVNNNNQINGAAVGGVVQEYNPQGTMLWEFVYSTSNYVAHHDITPMPNGGVLMTAWEVKNSTELTAAGYTGSSNVRYPTHFIEVQPDGNGGGQIVWEWHMWDHLIQDVDANKPSFGVVKDHPELMNINVATSGGGGPGGGGGDWFHVNGVNYNDSLDQIAFSSRYLSEIFIIDHSTTTAEAAGHTGGNSGKGGDLLYRWGHPANYNTSGVQYIPGPVHDVRWIESGRPDAGYLQFFNNDGNNGRSTVDAINPPYDGYNYSLTPGQAYGPLSYQFRHITRDDATGQSASNRMPNGNIFVALSREYMYEEDSLGNLVWQYNADPPKGFRYTCDHPGIIALLGANPCGITGIEENDLEHITFYPNPSSGNFYLSGIPQGNPVSEIVVMDMNGKVVKRVENRRSIDLTDQASGAYQARVTLSSGELVTQKLSLVR